MQTWIALLRGINVGGNNLLPMKELAELVRKIGLEDVRTTIQSGNLVFRSRAKSAQSLAKRIATGVEAAKGFRPTVLVLSAEELQLAASENPFPDALADPRRLHLFFLSERPTRADAAALERIRAGREAFVLCDRVFYLHTPDGLGTSKLGKVAERHLGVEATARNWNTVQKLLALSRAATG
jgi:uncharacterized protein (DUF1697 family)